MKEGTLEVVTNHSSLLGECPVWDESNKTVKWVDIINGDLHSFKTGSEEMETFNTGSMTGAVVVRSSGGMIAALKEGFAAINLNQQSCTLIASPADHPGIRFNDGKCDAAGRFWAGTMSLNGTPGKGKLYVLNADFSIDIKLEDISCSNGVGWSLDNTKFYFIDTPTRQVVAYDYDLINCIISKKKVIITIPESEGLPDGMTVDADGMLWIALWGGWKIIQCDPFTGARLHEIKLPVSNVTSCCFGGDEFEDLYITSARTGLTPEKLSSQPLAGYLFVIKNSGCKGLAPYSFAG